MKEFANIFRLVLCVSVLALTSSRALAAGPVVTIGNTPLPVTGTVSVDTVGTVTNLPPISGTVNVGNTPTVTVGNASLPVTGNVGITGIPTVHVENLAATQPVSGTVTVGNTASSPVPTQNVGGGAATHVGQPETSLVNLSCLTSAFNATGECTQLSKPDGTTSSGFTIPPGNALVITDIEWSLPSGNGAGAAASENLAYCQLSSPGCNIIASVSALGDKNGIVAGQWHFASGIVVAAGQKIFVDAFQGTSTSNFATLQGYLVPVPAAH